MAQYIFKKCHLAIVTGTLLQLEIPIEVYTFHSHLRMCKLYKE